MDSLVKQTVKGYEFREHVGDGGFGAVYRAFQPSVGREVAIKVILPEHANQPDFIRRFESEAQYVAHLEHPHIVPLYDYWRDPDGAFLVMRWLRGGSLRASLERSAWSLEKTAVFLDQIAGALAVAHREGIVHRDIKPDNILLDEDENAYLADFGIAKDVHIRELNKTAAGELIGSPAYISPEQIRQREITPRTDLYSLGYVLYEMLTGKKPFSDVTTASDYIEKHLSSPLPMISIQDNLVPAAVDEVLQTATAKDSTHRYPSAQRFAAAFRAAMPNRQPRWVEQPLVDPLTARELEVLKLMMDGLSSKQIAEKLVIAVSSVRWYDRQIYSKLDVHSRQQAIERASSLRLFHRPQIGRLPSPDSLIIAPHSENQPTLKGLEEPPLAVENPYKGLRAFQEADASDFFGRATLTERLLSRLSEGGDAARFLLLVGPSGSGKSSVVRAGLMTALRKGALTSAPHPFVTDFMPGDSPLEELEAALLRVATQPVPGLLVQLREDRRGLVRAAKRLLPNDNTTELILVVDQFEETFTLVKDEAMRVHFIDNLLSAAADPRGRIRVILTMRADFYDRPLMYPRLAEMMRSNTEIITPLSAREMEQSIVAPAERVGLRVEPGLVATILKDVGEQPGTLPLLQFALTELFEQREGLTLTINGYKATGGVLGALARRADEIYNSLGTDAKDLTRQMFLRLVTLGEGTEDTRRRASMVELNALDTNGSMEDVIDAFAGYRLLTLDRDPISHSPTVEIAHEALIREWGKLHEWLLESREDIRIQRRLATAAAEWNSGRDRSYLAYGSRLEQFETWAIDTNLALTTEERGFLDASLADRARSERIERERVAHEQKLVNRSRTRLHTLIAVLTVATVVALGLTTLAVTSASEAQSARATSEANFRRGEHIRLGSQAENTLDIGAGNIPALLAISSLKHGYLPQADAALLAASSRGILTHRFVEDSEFVIAAETSPDGRMAATAGADRKVRLWDVETGAMVRAIDVPYDFIETLDYAPDGRYLLIASSSPIGVFMWDTQTGEQVRHFGEPDVITYPAIFSPDGQYVLGATDDNMAILWDAETGEEVRRFTSHTNYVSDVAFSADSRVVATASGDMTVQLWDVDTGESLQTFQHSVEVFSVDLSADGKMVTVGEDRALHLWGVDSGSEIRTFGQVVDFIFKARFSPDGQLIAANNVGRSIDVWDANTGERVAQYTDPEFQNGWDNIAWLADGRYLLGGGLLWDAAIEPTPRVISVHEPGENLGPWFVTFSPDQRLILTAGPFTAEIFDAQTYERLYTLEPDMGIRSASFSPDSRYLFAAADADDAPEMLIEIATGDIVRTFEGHTAPANAVDYSPDGRTVVSSSIDATARLWDPATGLEIRRFEGHEGELGGAFFSPDGTSILTTSNDGTARLWDPASGEQIRLFTGEGIAPVAMGAFTPDGKRIATTHYDGSARIWDVETGEVLHDLRGHSGLAWGLAFSPDGKLLATGSVDGTAQLWDVNTGERLRVYTGHTNNVYFPAFTPDGRQILTTSDDGTIRIWNTFVEDDVAYLCSRLRHDFSAAERALYLITDDMLPSCG